MRLVVVTLAALVLAAAHAGAAQIPSSGLRGKVTRGPTTPVCLESVPCTAPAVGVVLQFWRSDALVARVRTGPAGGYALRLRAGVYSVTSSQVPRIGAGLTPRKVRVPRERIARVDFFIDTGIR